MKLKRGSGILLHITSLSTPYGIGDFGPSALECARMLAEAKQKYWQILPLNPTDDIFHNSPYSSPSAFALNPLLISPELLIEEGLLEKDEAIFAEPDDGKVDFTRVGEHKQKLLAAAFRRRRHIPAAAYEAFCREQADWLDDYALFAALKKEQGDRSWIDWPQPLRDREKKALQDKADKLTQEIEFIKFQQYTAHKQWTALKAACNDMGVRIIGDVPIYIEHGSVDVWRHPELFKLDAELRPKFVAGVPPDYFSETGQRWGNPIYNWQAMQADNFDWWAARLKRNLDLFDIVRIDHFRGLVAFWQVPASEKTAVKGDWIKAPTSPLFERLMQECQPFNVIAEDLGLMTAEVIEALERLHLPGMKVLQFAFDADLKSNAFLPHNYPENCIVYTGTHDNNTTRGWYRCDATDHEKWQLGAYVQREVNENNVCDTLIDLALSSRADTAIVPVQDILNLDESARMNLPGTTENNWNWRLRRGQLTPERFDAIRQLTQKFNR